MITSAVILLSMCDWSNSYWRSNQRGFMLDDNDRRIAEHIDTYGCIENKGKLWFHICFHMTMENMLFTQQRYFCFRSSIRIGHYKDRTRIFRNFNLLLSQQWGFTLQE
jgi:hypothetical protein